MNTLLGHLGIEGPLWFNDAVLVEAVPRPAGDVGRSGATMIIFLAAVLDVPKHLYESASSTGPGRSSSCAG